MQQVTTASESAYKAQRLIENADLSFFAVEMYDFTLLLVGFIILVAVILPRITSTRRIITAPLIYLGAGALMFLMPWTPSLPDLVNGAWWPKRLTELCVIVSLTSAGLKLNRPFARETWQISWRLLAITMPLTIAACAWLGWQALGLVPASALLLGAVIAPTDPVLASDIQTTPPDQPDHCRARLALTTEAGLNDGLAFPFTNLAIAISLAGIAPSGWLSGWLLVDVFYKITIGTLVGAFSGWLMAHLLYKFPATRHLAKTMTGITALSLTLVPYGVSELLSSYGFVAVFVAACMFRQVECSHDYQVTLHDFAEEAERVFVAVLMFLIGGYAADGLLGYMTPVMYLAALIILFVIRPVTGLIGLAGLKMSMKKRCVISFLGIRGIGSIYYLAYAVHHANFPEAMNIWAIVVAIIIISVIIHGLTARHLMAWLMRDLKRQTRHEKVGGSCEVADLIN